jgi:hypothetical protein
VPQTGFDLVCDQLSHIVDKDLFERLRWDRTEAPMLAHLVALAQGAIESRDEYELTEEGSSKDIKRFILKVHSFRVAAIAIGLEGHQAVVMIDQIDRSKYRLAKGPLLTADFAEVDEQWMAAALAELFGRVQV